MELETDDLIIHYDETDDSFSHEFGTRHITGYEITKIEAFIPALDGWMDVTHLREFSDLADKRLDKHLS